MEKNYVEFTADMKNEYTILVPTMLPMHFRLLLAVLRTYGYKTELLETSGPEIAEMGLKHVHNDTCYPAILVIGQFMNALKTGKYDPHKTALMLFQSGGGCRASNYISLLRKALKNAGYDYVPVIPFGIAGIEKHSGFELDLKKLHALMYAVCYGDLLMSLVNQCRPYEKNKGEAQRLADLWTERLGEELGATKRIRYAAIKRNYAEIVSDFSKIELARRPAVKVGVVGEIFVKYSPLGNNNLEQFLFDEGAEVVVPGLLDFCLYTLYNNANDYKMYKRGTHAAYTLYTYLYKFMCKKKNDMAKAIIKGSDFTPATDFEETVKLSDGYISTGAKMGEGWLLTAEMLELAHMGVKNIVCTQPFGCLPNHICGKGMMKLIKEKQPDVNIVAIDYDAGATRVNQINRLKLMLANAKV
ncbi:MAG: 2-hydroxyacyl-CoA dehydratase [Clostridia bacterium]|nr:2-hydroxyacyl-CoA dehydratase [Clostridia bacterium]